MGIVIKNLILSTNTLRTPPAATFPSPPANLYSAAFDHDDLYEVLPMFAAVADALGTDDGRVLHLLEDILNMDMPRFIDTREEIFDCLVETGRERLGMS